MTPRSKDYRNLCKDLKFLDLRIVCIKAILDDIFIDFRFTFCCWFTSYILFCFCFGFSNI